MGYGESVKMKYGILEDNEKLENMKVLQVIPYFVPAWDYGGPLRGCYTLSRELVKRGHEVTVFTTDALNETQRVSIKEEILDGIQVKRFRNLNNYIAYRHNISTPVRMCITTGLKIKTLDIIHIREYRTLTNIFICQYALKHHIPYILQAHGSLPRIIAKQKLKYVYDILVGYRILRNATKVIALTPLEAEEYESMGVNREKIEIVPNGVVLSEFDTLPEKGRFRRKYGISDNHKIILFVGRIHVKKRLDVLSKAFAILLSKIATTKLVIIGPDDGYLPTVKKLINELRLEEKVLLLGPLYDVEKLEAYVDADVFVLPTIHDTFPNTILESCACGTPVIVTDRCQIKDEIIGKAGLVTSCDKDELAEAIMRILDDAKLSQEFSDGGKLLVREKFNSEVIADQFERIYNDCIHSGVERGKVH